MAESPAGRHVALVGLMGSGKSTVGRKLAGRLDRPFVDGDDALLEATGRTVRQWFETEGEAAFRTAEVKVLAGLLEAPEPSVIATGGGIVCTAAGRALLAGPDVTVVWLQASAGFVAHRVSQKANKDHRPLLDADPLEVLVRHAAERGGWYAEVADIVVDIDPVHRDEAKPKKRLAEMVLEALNVIDDEKAALAPADDGVATGVGSDRGEPAAGAS